MDVQMLSAIVATPYGDREVEPVADYLDALDTPRFRCVQGRIELLYDIDPGDYLPNPPFEEVRGERDLHQLVVDYDGEHHRVVFGNRAGVWLLVGAFLDEGHVQRLFALRTAIDLWRSPTLP